MHQGFFLVSSSSCVCMQLNAVHFLVEGCKRDSNGYYWITGRTDDCMNVSGHLLSTAQVESALVEHDAVTEAAVVSLKPCLKELCRKFNLNSNSRSCH